MRLFNQPRSADRNTEDKKFWWYEDVEQHGASHRTRFADIDLSPHLPVFSPTPRTESHFA